MRRAIIFLISTILFITFIISGCMSGGQFGSPSPIGPASISGKVVIPYSCFADGCDNTKASGDKPLPYAEVTLVGSNGDIISITTDCSGAYTVNNAIDTSYILTARREKVVVKQAITVTPGKMNNAGEANLYTTAQVLLYEKAIKLYPGMYPLPMLKTLYLLMNFSIP